MNRLWLAPALLVVAGCVSGRTHDLGGGDQTAQAPSDAVTIGSCAPIRYREIEPGELEPKRHTPRSPPPPVSFSVRTSFTPKPAHKTIASTIKTQLTRAKRDIIRCIDEELDDGRAKYLRLTVYVHSHGVRLTRLFGVRDSKRRQCAERVIRAKLRARSSPQAHLNFSILVGPRAKSESKPPDPQRRRGTVEILSNSDRADEGLALTSSMVAARGKLERCLATTKQTGTGISLAELTIDENAVSASVVEGDGDNALHDCWASALSGLAAPSVDAGGFQCALSFGHSKLVPLDLVLSVEPGGLIVDGEAIPVLTGQQPPTSRVYKQLLALRFADRRPSPAPAVLRIAGQVSGETIIGVVGAARAADIDITTVVVGDDSSPISMIETPRPRLGRYVARNAALSILVGPTEVWLGLGFGLEEAVHPTSDSEAIASVIARLAKVPGIAGRRDALIGIELSSRAEHLAPIIRALRSAGFDQLELESAESVRARLAQ